jgi:hypothetical protein
MAMIGSALIVLLPSIELEMVSATAHCAAVPRTMLDALA